jgi:enamine deaminase RidA (YjgF/YER057c/UK114 family)
MRRMNDAEITARLSELGIELPPPPKAVAAYVPVKIAGTTVHVAGQVPMQGGLLMFPGHLGRNVAVGDGQAAARQAALQALSALRDALGGFERLETIAQVTVYVASTADFVDHPTVANGASEVLAQEACPRGDRDGVASAGRLRRGAGHRAAVWLTRPSPRHADIGGRLRAG